MKTEDMNDPKVVDEKVTSMLRTLIEVTDPRILTVVLLQNAGALTQFIIKSNKWTPQQATVEFSSALITALEPAEIEPSRIQLLS